MTFGRVFRCAVALFSAVVLCMTITACGSTVMTCEFDGDEYIVMADGCGTDDFMSIEYTTGDGYEKDSMDSGLTSGTRHAVSRFEVDVDALVEDGCRIDELDTVVAEVEDSHGVAFDVASFATEVSDKGHQGLFVDSGDYVLVIAGDDAVRAEDATTIVAE